MSGLSGLRLPIGQEFADIDIRLQFSLFVVGQLTFIGADIKLFNPDGIVLREVECQDAFGESRSHSVPGQIEYAPENIGVRLRAKRRGSHLF